MVTKRELTVTGIHCSGCAGRLGTALERLEGVLRAEVEESGRAVVRYDEARLDEDQLAEQVRTAGFDLV